MNLENDLFIIYFFWIMYNIFFNLLANKFSARKKFISRKLPFIIECFVPRIQCPTLQLQTHHLKTG